MFPYGLCSITNEYDSFVFSDQFGTDLTSVEAAFKKQEAIQTDISAFEERLQNIMAIANELKTEDYHDYLTIEARKKNVEMHWEYLVSLVNKRRRCLESAYNMQRVFQVGSLLLCSLTTAMNV
jgi:spectrin beta